MKSEQFCLACDDGTRLQHDKRDLAFVYRDQPLEVAGVSGWHCPACGECEFDDSEGKRYSAEVDAFLATVDAEIAQTLRTLRKKLGLKQAEAGRLFGDSVNAFSEYERGKTRPPKATVLLLRLLGRHPELLKEIR